MSDLSFPEPESADAPYPAVRLLRRHGAIIAVAFGVVPALGGLWAMLVWGGPGGGIGWLVGGVAAGAAVGFLMRSYVELVRIIADMLLPR
jgi:hypothetical protein